MSTKLFLSPGTNYKIELEPRIDKRELQKKGVTQILVADPDDSDDYDHENYATTCDGVNGEFA